MAVPAAAFDEGSFVEERIARLEAKTSRIQSDVTDMKADIRRIEGKVDAVKYSIAALEARIAERVAASEVRMAEQLGALNRPIVKIDLDRLQDHLWWLLFAGTALTVAACAFKLI